MSTRTLRRIVTLFSVGVGVVTAATFPQLKVAPKRVLADGDPVVVHST